MRIVGLFLSIIVFIPDLRFKQNALKAKVNETRSPDSDINIVKCVELNLQKETFTSTPSVEYGELELYLSSPNL